MTTRRYRGQTRLTQDKYSMMPLVGQIALITPHEDLIFEEAEENLKRIDHYLRIRGCLPEWRERASGSSDHVIYAEIDEEAVSRLRRAANRLSLEVHAGIPGSRQHIPEIPNF